MTRVRIENVVASTSLGDAFDLQTISGDLTGAEYEPAQFPGLIFRMQEPRTAILLFHSGKVVCTGGKSWHQVDESIRTISTLLRKGGHKVIEHPKITVQNIVATADLGSEINLNLIAVTLGLDRVEYEPEQFPGLVCRMQEPRVVILLFGSGKLVCTGARKPADLSRAVDNITKELRDAGLLGQDRARSPPAVKFQSAPKNRPVMSTSSGTARSPAVPAEASLTASPGRRPSTDDARQEMLSARSGLAAAPSGGDSHLPRAPSTARTASRAGVAP